LLSIPGLVGARRRPVVALARQSTGLHPRHGGDPLFLRAPDHVSQLARRGGAREPVPSSPPPLPCDCRRPLAPLRAFPWTLPGRTALLRRPALPPDGHIPAPRPGSPLAGGDGVALVSRTRLRRPEPRYASRRRPALYSHPADGRDFDRGAPGRAC